MKKIYTWLVKKLLLKVYPWWDYTFLMQLVSDWTKQAAVEYKRNAFCAGGALVSKELSIISEYTYRLATDGAFSQMCDEEYKPYERALKLEKEYLEAMSKLMNRKLKSWWD